MALRGVEDLRPVVEVGGFEGVVRAVVGGLRGREAEVGG